MLFAKAISISATAPKGVGVREAQAVLMKEGREHGKERGKERARGAGRKEAS